MSSLLRQVALLAAGCQPWHKDVCAANGDRFAYCATLAVYIYELDRRFNKFMLHSIMSEHKKTITAISWSPTNVDLFASASVDNQLIIWNVAEQVVVARLNNLYSGPSSVGWCTQEKDTVSYICELGPLCVWNFTHTAYPGSSPVATHKETSFSIEVCMFRWHPMKAGKIAFGHGDGSMSFICPGTRNQKHVLTPEHIGDDDKLNPITALEWDPLSVTYLLTCNKHTGVRLIDTEAVSIIATFKLPSAATCVHTLAWIKTAPGMFLTGDALTGVLRVWNVSKSTPIESIRLKKTGFHVIHVFSPMQGAMGNNPNSCMRGLPASAGSGSLSAAQYALPPAHVVCTFLDGGVGLYDLGKRRWNFLRDYGHIETIFDCQFKPDNPNLIATGSFDGTIKVWDVTTLTLVDSSPGNEGVIYSLCWAPGDLNCIVASTSKYGAFIWDINKGKVIKRFREHGKASVFSVAWNQKDPKHIATCGGDGYCIIHQVDGKIVMKYKHPAGVFGCDWNPNNKDMLATGCDDKKVRIFYLSTTTEQPLKVFPGHKAKVFKVKWCPLREGILCSGSDDGTIRVWDYSQESCITTLHGHTAPVRGLLWNTEIPYLLISGSWDYSIRVWDTRDGVCLDDIRDHGADVYGLTCHSQRPFVLASCSRDSTMRIWSMAPLTQPLEISILAGQPYDRIIAPTEQAMSMRLGPQLCGRESRGLKQLLDELPQDDTIKRLRTCSNLFRGVRGSLNLWELVCVVNGQQDLELSPDYGKGIMHKKHITSFKAAEAQELEMVKMSKFGAGLGAPSKEDRLREAADINIRLGNLQKYCELMLELNQWEKALSVAPGVSLQYWKSLAQRRAESLMLEDSEDIIPLCTATGNARYLVKFFTNQGQLQNAMVTAVAASEGSIATPAPVVRTKDECLASNGIDGIDAIHTDLLEETSTQLADWYFSGGSGVLAACCHLAVDDGQGAMLKLLRSSEFELALSIGRVLKGVDKLTATAAEYLAQRCERLGRWDLAVDLLGTVTDEKKLLVAMVCARCGETLDEINLLHEKAGFPAMDECLTLAESLRTEDSVMECVKYYLLSSSPELGLEIGLKHVKNVISGTQWQADDVWHLLQLLASIRTEKLQQHHCDRMRTELMALCAYVGGLMAVRRKYNSIVVPLFKHVEELLHNDSADPPLSVSRVLSQMEAWKANQVSTDVRSASEEVFFSVEQQEHCDELMRRAGPEPLFLGPDVVSSSNLPSHVKVYKSHLNKQIIRGPVYFLEDGRSAISISDAVMWAKVNPFSPFGSGLRINPF